MCPQVTLTKLDPISDWRQKWENTIILASDLIRASARIVLDRERQTVNLPHLIFPNRKDSINVLPTFMKRCSHMALCLGATIAQADEYDVVDVRHFFVSTDPLAQRSEWGLVHQTPHVNATTLRPLQLRWCYYFKANEQLIVQPAYVGSNANGVYPTGVLCGPINGVFTPE